MSSSASQEDNAMANDNTAADAGDPTGPAGGAQADPRADGQKVEQAEFGSLEDESAVATDVNLEVLLDVSVTLALEVGRSKMSIRDLLQLNQGSVVELDRQASEPMDVLVNGTLVAHGEIVVVNDKFGIRLTDVVSPAERVKKLNNRHR